MKSLFAALLVAGLPAFALAQAPGAPGTATKAAAAPAKPAAGPAATRGSGNGARHGARQRPMHDARPAPKSRAAAKKMAPPVEPDAGIELSPAALAVAQQVYVGTMKCELGASVTVTPLARPGLFQVTIKKHRFRMHPVESRTGAIRLEDPDGGAVWIQLSNKSMLMSQKLGQRLADECQSPEQVTQAEFLKRNPPRSLLEDEPEPEPQPQPHPQPAPAVQPAAASAPADPGAAAPGATAAPAAAEAASMKAAPEAAPVEAPPAAPPEPAAPTAPPQAEPKEAEPMEAEPPAPA